MDCFCGCGQSVSGMRSKAANQLGAQITTLVAVLDGAPSVEGIDASAYDGLAVEGHGHEASLRDVVHGTGSRKDVDKSALRSFTDRAIDAQGDLGKQAIKAGYVGPAGSIATLPFTGTRSTGMITALDDTGTTVNNSFRARVDIAVDGPDGSSFPVHRTVSISRMALPRVGDHVTVAYSPDDPMDFVYRVSIPPAAARAVASGGSADRIAQLKELAGLRDSGVLSETEFEAEKQRLLAE